MRQLLAILPLIVSLAATAEPLSFDAIRAIVEKNNVRSVEELIRLLPEEFRKNSILLYDSRSQQPASFEEPRVILTSRDASFMAAYSGAEGKANSDNFEIIEFNRARNEFEFRQIKFAGPDQSPVFEAHPTQCMNCHGKIPRPIWDTYPMWPGAYGSVSQSGFFSPETEALERGKLDEFVKTSAKKPRYAPLEISDSILLFALEQRNDRLSQMLTGLNSERLAGWLGSHSEYDAHKSAFEKAFARSDEFLASMPKGSGDKSVFEKLAASTHQANLDYVGARLKRQTALTSFIPRRPDLDSDSSRNVARARFILEKMGLPADQLAFPLGGRSYAFTDGFYGFRGLGEATWDLLKKKPSSPPPSAPACSTELSNLLGL